MSRGALKKMLRKWSENRSSRFEAKILLISFLRGSGPPTLKRACISSRTIKKARERKMENGERRKLATTWLILVLLAAWFFPSSSRLSSMPTFRDLGSFGAGLQSVAVVRDRPPMLRDHILRLRGGGRLYVTATDLKNAGIDPDYDPELWEYENWGAIQRSKKEMPDLPEPLWSWLNDPVAEQGDEDNELTPLQHATILAQQPRTFHPIEELKKNELVEVLGIAFDGTFDNETTTIMQIRLSIERTDYHALRRSMHNAAELDFWTDRLEEAFNIGRSVMEELHRKEDYRFHQTVTPQAGRIWVTTEELYGLRVPIPPRLAETSPTYADMMMGPRDGATRLRIDPDITMDENMALWDALDSHLISTKVFPDVANLTFENAALESIYQTKVAGAPEAYHPTVTTPWPALKKLALERAHEAMMNGERGEVGSPWYRAQVLYSALCRWVGWVGGGGVAPTICPAQSGLCCTHW